MQLRQTAKEKLSAALFVVALVGVATLAAHAGNEWCRAGISTGEITQAGHKETYFEKLLSDPVAHATVALAIVTGLLVLATYSLFWGAEKAARQQLRAYVGHMPSGCKLQYDPNRLALIFAYYEQNHGKTPALNIRMGIHVCADIPSDFGGPFTVLSVLPMAHPQQNIGKIVPVDFGKLPSDLRFFFYGYVEYEDVFGDKWKRRFSFLHNASNHSSVEDEWVAHSHHNDELKWDKKDRIWRPINGIGECSV